MNKRVGDILTGIITYLIVIGIPAIVARLAWLKQVPVYLIILMALGAIVLSLSALILYSIYKKGRKKNISKLSDKRIEGIVREWINIPIFKVEKQLPQEGIIFNYAIEYGQGLFINIVKDTTNTSLITLRAGVRIFEDNWPMDEPKLKRAVRDIKIEMARLGIEYKIKNSPQDNQYIDIFNPVLLDDSLTEFYFRQRILFVIRAMVLIIEIAKQLIET